MLDDVKNTCDKCGKVEWSKDLVWIDAEDFEPLKEDKFNRKQYMEALKKNYSALCDDCYYDECCEG